MSFIVLEVQIAYGDLKMMNLVDHARKIRVQTRPVDVETSI